MIKLKLFDRPMRTLALFSLWLAAPLMGGGGCDSLRNPHHIPVGVSYAQDGTLTVLFWDGLATMDADLGIARWTDYPQMPPQTSHAFVHALSADGKYVLMAWGDEGSVSTETGIIPPTDKPAAVIFAAADGAIAHTFELPFAQRPLNTTLSDDGSILFAQLQTAESGSSIAAYRVSDGAELWTKPGQLAHLTYAPGQGAVVGVDIERVINGASPVTFRILDAATGETRMEVPLPSLESVQDMSVAADGTVAVVSGNSHADQQGTSSGRYPIIRLADGSLADEVVGPNELLGGLRPAISSAGRFLATAASRTAERSTADGIIDFFIWADGGIRLQEGAWNYSWLAFSPDNTRLVGVNEKGAVLYNMPDGTVLQRNVYPEQIF